MAGRMINGAAALAELIRTAGEIDTPGVHRVLPVLPELSGLLPGRGLRRGSTIAIATSPPSQAERSSQAERVAQAGGAGQVAQAGQAGRAMQAGGATSLLLALLSEASRAGSWCAVVGVPALGALAAAESGIVLDRLALVPDPGPDWPTVVAALIDGVDVVVAAVPGRVSPTIAARLVARARQRGCVLVPFGHWDGADVTLQVTAGRWEGLGAGRGRLRRREVTVLARGRGAAARPKEITLWMPGVTTRPPRLPPAPSAADPPPGSVPPAPDPPTPRPSPSALFAFAPPPSRPSARLPPACLSPAIPIPPSTGVPVERSGGVGSGSLGCILADLSFVHPAAGPAGAGVADGAGVGAARKGSVGLARRGRRQGCGRLAAAV